MSSEKQSSSEWYWKQHLFWDACACIAAATLFWLASHYGHLEPRIYEILSGSRASLYGALVSSYGSLLGFVITAATFCAAFTENESFRKLRQFRSFADIFAIYGQSAVALSLGFVAALIGIVFDSDKHSHMWVEYLNIFAFLFVAARISKSVWVLGQLTRMHLLYQDYKKEHE